MSAPRRSLLALVAFASACGGEPAVVSPPAPPPVASGVPKPAPVVVPGSHATAAVPVAEGDATWGSATAPVTIVAFGTCGLHVDLFESKLIGALRKDLGHEGLRVVLKHGAAGPERLAVLAAAVQVERGLEGYLEFCKAARKDNLEFARDEVLEEAERRMAVPDEVREKAAARVAADRVAARRLLLVGPNALPQGFFVNGKWLRGADDDERRRAIEEEGAAAKEALAKGTSREDLYVVRTAANHRAEDVLPEEMRERWLAPLAGHAARGPAGAAVTIVGWGDFQCPFCRKAHGTLTNLEKRYPGQIRYVFRNKPLGFHKGAAELAALALEARAQKGDAKFWALHDDFMAGKADALVFGAWLDAKAALAERRRLGGDKEALKAAEATLKDETTKLEVALQAFAKEHELDPKKTVAAVLGGAWDAQIELDERAGDDAGVSGTPTFFVNGRRVTGAQSEDLFAGLVELEIAANAKRGVAPEKLYEELQRGGKTRTRELPKLDAADPARGPAKGKATLDVFCSYAQAGVEPCARLAFQVRELEAANKNQLRVVWHAARNGWDVDSPALAALLEAKAQKGSAAFFKLNDLLLALPHTALLRPAIEEQARKAGLDGKRLAAALDAGKHKAEEEARGAEVKRVSLPLPAVVIDGRVVTGDRVRRAVALAVSPGPDRRSPSDPPAVRGKAK